LLAVTASEPLMDSIRRLLEIIAAKSAILSGLRFTKDRARADWTVADIENFWLLYTMNGALPVLQDICNEGTVNAGATVHPRELFGELLAFAGTLTTFSEKIAPKHLPAYDHDNLGGCFSDLAKKLIELLEGNGKVNFVSLALRPVQRFIYASSIDDEKYLTDTHLYLAVSAKLPDSELADRILRSAKMCSATHMDHLLKHALPGIRLIHVPTPSSIPVKVDYQYFALERSGAAWQSVERARNIAVFLPEIPSPKAEVFVDFG
jgi:type VI secretion system protein ImpJ